MVELADFGGWSGVLGRLLNREDIGRDGARVALDTILSGEATPAQIAALIVALRMKGESTEELTGMLDALFSVATLVPVDLDSAPVVDIVGSGGDGSQSINVSTISALVVAGAGAKVCKHGNRSASSRSGAADVLEELGVKLEVTPEVVATCVAEIGMGFCFAQRFHPAMRHVGPPRRELGVPTVFNYLGPVANPGRVRRLLLGVGDAAMARPMVEVLAARGAERVWVVHGNDGMDELSTTGPTAVLDLSDGVITELTVDPSEFGLATASRADLVIEGPQEAAAAARAVLAGSIGPHRDIVLLNAGAALVVAGLVDDLSHGMALAATSIDSGAAAAVLHGLVERTNV